MKPSPRTYFDNAATTRLDPRVRAAMAPFFEDNYGNPSSLHAEGRAAREAVTLARAQIAELVEADPKQIIFTAGGSEADNLALIGVATAAGGQHVHIITSAIEHPAILETCRFLARRPNVTVSLLPVDADGIVKVAELEQIMRPETRLVSVMAANNVSGVLQPIADIARIAHAHNALFHTDAVQALGKLPIHVERDGIDLLSLSGHKIHGPKGIGALVARQRELLAPIIHGGGQEGGLRSGTENTPAIVGLGAAAALLLEECEEERVRLVELREQLIEGVLAAIPGAYLIGHRRRRLPGHACFGIAGLEGESITLMLALDEAGFAVSTGSACSAHKAADPSYVLQALGFDAFRSRGALRLTLGRFNTAAEVERFVAVLPGLVARLRPITTRNTRVAGV
jgi:cysteine desulfurase